MKKGTIILTTLIIGAIFLLSVPYAWEIVNIIFNPKRVTLFSQLEIYKWVSVGVVAYVVLRRLLKKNLTFLEVFSHEFTHTVVALLFNRKVHSFQAGEQSGVICTSGKRQYALIPVSLAPYCFPILTYILLSIRWMLDFHGVWIYDVLIGITMGFYFYCFKTQMNRQQPDINQYPLLFSYFYIITIWVVNICLILPAFFPNMNGHGNTQYHYGVWSCMYRLVQSWWGTIENIVHSIL